MNQSVKLVLYVGLTLALGILGYSLYSTLNSPDAATAPAPPRATAPATPPGGSPDTNQATTATVATATDSTKPPATTNATASVAPLPVTSAEDNEFAIRRSSRNLGRATAYGVAMFFVFIGLAIVIARDISRYLGGRVENFIFNDNLEGMKDPEYEEAEHIWAKGEHLEAVRLMRGYLIKHPREQYVALRIAEIYETNLRNYLAAALEYEEVLKKKLPPERWGWAAIHLANLYSGKLDKVPEATQLLHRIVNEYGKTAAAKKARERLGIPEPVEEPPPSAKAPANDPTPAKGPAAIAAEDEPEESAEPEPAAPPPSHNLPKGFRPK